MFIGFFCGCNRRQRELTNNKNIKGKNHVRLYLKDVFGSVEHHETGTYGFGYKLTMTRNTDNSVLIEYNAINNAKMKMNARDWYVPQYT